MCGNSPGFVTSPPTISPVGYMQLGILILSTVVRTDNSVKVAACTASLEYSSHSVYETFNCHHYHYLKFLQYLVLTLFALSDW